MRRPYRLFHSGGTLQNAIPVGTIRGGVAERSAVSTVAGGDTSFLHFVFCIDYRGFYYEHEFSRHD